MRRERAKFERGVALLAFVAVVGLVASWFLVKQLNLEPPREFGVSSAEHMLTLL